MTKKLVLVFLLPFMVDLAISCCDCLDTVTHHYTNKTIVVSALDNSGQKPKEIPAGSVIKSAFGIRIQVNREKLARINKPAIVFGQAAYAYSCGCARPFEFLPNDSITGIHVITLHDFDNDHPANSDVTSYFKVNMSSFISIEDYLSKYLEGTFYEEMELHADFNIFLMTPPVSGGAHQFRIRFILSDGRILEQDTPTLDFI